MQFSLINSRITASNIIQISDYQRLKNKSEFILYSDNILEGIALLNDISLVKDSLEFYGVIYEPIDQPIYIFKDEKKYYSIKICGLYSKWQLPKDVSQIISFIDFPDYVLYSLDLQKAILAGENTETASVGNSQWQREGRKLGAAKASVPFIYQTFYSGRDESQDTIREPNSLQVYNHLIYTIRYKTPSIVAYFKNSFKDSSTKRRDGSDSKLLFAKYIQSIIVASINVEKVEVKKQYEQAFYIHMINYIKESKDFKSGISATRIVKDFPIINSEFLNDLVENTEEFVKNLVSYIYEKDYNKVTEYIKSSKILDFDKEKFQNLTSYNNKNNIKDLLIYLNNLLLEPKSYIPRSAKVGFVDTNATNAFFASKFPEHKESINKILDAKIHKETLVFPLRIHKKSKNFLTFSPDPESGEIVAFAEMFAKDLYNNITKPIVGYCIVDTPEEFDLFEKKGTKLFKAIAQYVDLLVINNDYLYYGLKNVYRLDNYKPLSLLEVKPTGYTEEMAIVSTLLNQTIINSDWKLCFVHTHHSSWQQMIIYKENNSIQDKIHRVSIKVDLILQSQNTFMISEGKNDYQSILTDTKIQTAMRNASKKIDDLYDEENIKFDAFIYNLKNNPNKNPAYYVSKEEEMIQGAMELGHSKDVANQNNYLIVIVYIDELFHTRFKLVYSPGFDKNIKERLDKEFNQ